ncbi:unnamed protein product [Heligmosomoides polygyrus]|uniref:Apolipoprotein D n=1 Tax=Heligmosomoides polygyrus TaxID=6339 RepID=A0A183FWU7_HELPZ|nr:unnamed protein product [Heligmosomoides polygyrus]
MRLAVVLLLVPQLRQVFSLQPKGPEWEKDTVHFVPPENWETYDIPRAIKQHMEYEWSLSSYTNECGEENSIKIVPVYFWPGDQVDLPCLMCELAFVFNGKMKIWGKSTKILKFLENPRRGTRFSYNLWSRVQNGLYAYSFATRNTSLAQTIDRMPEVIASEGNRINTLKYEPVYIQRKGKLTIIRASPASQGVYFCYDGQSRLDTSIFYVLMAMTPPVRMSEMKDVLADGCIEKEDHQHIRANFNWRYHFLPNFRHEAPKSCKRSRHRFCTADYVRGSCSRLMA